MTFDDPLTTVMITVCILFIYSRYVIFPRNWPWRWWLQYPILNLLSTLDNRQNENIDFINPDFEKIQMLIDKPKVFEVHKVEKRARLLCVQLIKLALLVMENQMWSQNSKSKIRISLLKFEFPLSKIQIYILGHNILSYITIIFLNVHKDPKYGFLYKVEKI